MTKPGGRMPSGERTDRSGRPPRLPEWLFAALLPPEDRDPVLGDLVEEYEERLAGGESPWRSGLWYWREMVGSIRWAAVLRLRRRSRRRAEGRRRPEREGKMRTFLQDVRHTGRLALRYPVFSAMVVGTLALGIAANTVVFSVVDGLVLNPFPYPEGDRLVGIGPEYPRLGQELGYWEVLSPVEYVEIRDGTRTLEREVAWDMGNRQVTIGETTENLFSALWWGDAFETLGVRPALGRGFLPEEIGQRERVAIVSHRVWQSRFGADEGLIGRPVLVNGDPYTLVGVMPPGTLIYGTDLWLPMPVGPEVYPRGARQMQMLARLAPGMTLDQARAELRTLASRIEAANAEAHPEYQGWRLEAATWQDINVGRLRPAALILMGAVGFLLLLVSANVATLFLVRASGRRAELAVRTALGAGRLRLLRQLLTESVGLALVGGALGIALGWLGVNALVAALSVLPILIPGEVAVNTRVLGFSAMVSIAMGIVFGIVPALQRRRLSVSEELKAEGAATTGSARRLSLQRAFVGVEVALAVVLLVAGGLLVHSFLRLQAVDPGFNPQGVLTMRLTLPWESYGQEEIEIFFEELLRQVEEIPGVGSAATATQFPPGAFNAREFEIEGMQTPTEGSLPNAFLTVASPGYLETMQIPVLRGRALSAADLPEGPRIAVIDETTAARFFPGQDPTGRRIRLADDGPADWMEIVGVVGATRNTGLDADPVPEIYVSSRQVFGANQRFLLIRGGEDPRALLPAVRREIQSLDPQQPVYLIRTAEEAFAQADAARRVSTVALALFSGFALLLASVGIYGLISFAVGQRRREMGLRIALGAEAGQVRWLFVRHALLPVLVGAAVGLAGALSLTGLMSSLLFEISGTDPGTLAAVMLILLAVALGASYLPARRASRLDPAMALRQDG